MADGIRQLGIREVTFYRWRKEYGGMSGALLRHLKELGGGGPGKLVLYSGPSGRNHPA